MSHEDRSFIHLSMHRQQSSEFRDALCKNNTSIGSHEILNQKRRKAQRWQLFEQTHTSINESFLVFGILVMSS
jgi:hypothetical protein